MFEFISNKVQMWKFADRKRQLLHTVMRKWDFFFVCELNIFQSQNLKCGNIV